MECSGPDSRQQIHVVYAQSKAALVSSADQQVQSSQDEQENHQKQFEVADIDLVSVPEIEHDDLTQ